MRAHSLSEACPLRGAGQLFCRSTKAGRVDSFRLCFGIS